MLKNLVVKLPARNFKFHERKPKNMCISVLGIYVKNVGLKIPNGYENIDEAILGSIYGDTL